jgi:PLP dependent protein
MVWYACEIMTMIAANLQRVRQRIQTLCVHSGRAADSVRLLAVSKTFGVDAVQAAYDAGQTAFGENYIQEAVDKITTLRHLPLEWHCIGPIQSNKTRLVAEHFDWVHSVDRLKIAQRLSEQRPATARPLQICLQVNIDGGANKSGVTPTDVFALADAVAALPQLQLRGLMFIPEPAIDLIAEKRVFTGAMVLFDQVKQHLERPDTPPQTSAFDTLSMGMTADLDSAIAAGSTMVRVGTGIFGTR